MELTYNQKRRRFFMMAFGAFAIFFTGYPHVWSIYQPYAIALTGWSQGQAAMCFYLAMCTFVFGNILGGRLQDKYNPRIAIMIGGGVFAAGIMLSSLALQESPIFIYLTYGVMQGFGQGMIYTTIISTAQKWFPGKTGFASGVVVTANGLCGFFLAPASKVLLADQGIKVTFLIVGGMIAVSWILGCIFIKNPKKEHVAKDDADSLLLLQHAAVETKVEPYQYTSMEMIQTKKFYFLLATMLFGLISYFIISPLSQTIQLERGISASVAVSAVMFGSICNAGARLILPTISDKIGRISCIKGVLIVQMIAMVLLIVAPSYITTIAVVLLYGCYGGIMGSFPSLSSSIFGIEHSGENYGFVMFGIVIATLGAPMIAHLVTVNGYDINVAFGCGAACAVLSFVCLMLLDIELKKTRNVKDNNAEKLKLECK